MVGFASAAGLSWIYKQATHLSPMSRRLSYELATCFALESRHPAQVGRRRAGWRIAGDDEAETMHAKKASMSGSG